MDEFIEDSVETQPLIQGGFVDIHAHFFPDRMFSAVWKFFEKHNWSIYYKDSPDALAGMLRGFGASHFTILNYLHKPGMRDTLAEWTRAFALQQPGAIPFGTLYPGEPGNLDAARQWFDEWDFRGIKIQPLVSCKPIPDPSMYPVFELMSERGKWLVIHAGTAPYPNEFTSLDHFEKLLSDFPNMKAILCHMGGFDYARALDLLDMFPNLCLDTTMIFVNTDVFDSTYPIPYERLLPYQDRLFFGSDFPNIPYPYSESVDGLLRLGLGDDFLNRVFRDNAKRFFEL
ncbi:MAG: amidohydrolase family protein [bacterium]